ncbi:Ribosomal biogenesis factor [Apodemus speciosus]|uniref:Ribosomal biogenesis factor n=1 Tax=Apodemus speciosus TaxID=105296 RepID=A0ABQ0EJU7_APOSI
MAKNKLKGQKSRNVFHIATHKTFKAKNKAKPVTTNLKKEVKLDGKINITNHEKVNRMNRAFVNIQKELANFSKSLSLKSVQKELKHHGSEPANVDEATRLMAQL